MIFSRPGVSFSVKVNGLKELDARLSKISNVARSRGAIAMTMKGAQVFASEARKRVPFKKGILKKSVVIKRFRKGSKTRFIYIIGNAIGKQAKYDGWYGRLVERGTKAHTIRAKHAKVLRTEEGVFLGVQVTHPGAKKKPWLKPTFDQTWRKALKEMAKKYKKYVELKERP